MSQRPDFAATCEVPLARRDGAKREAGDDAAGRALGRVSSWRRPPHWSRQDWRDEVRAIVQSGAACAGLDFDPRRRVPLRAHLYMRAVAAAWTRYRQEWSYYWHAAAETIPAIEPVSVPSDHWSDDDAINHYLERALNQLSLEDQLLIRHLYWNETSQHRVATTLHISQQCVSKRKTRVLRQLRQLLHGQAQVLSRFLTLGWFLLDSLDLLPAIDLL